MSWGFDNREKNSQEFYRTAQKSAYTREKKKLLSKENWYKNCPEQEQEEEREESPRKYFKSNNQTRIPRTGADKKLKRTQVKSVMFVPFTKNGELAKQLRENEESLSNLTGTRIKIVE